MMLPLRNSIKGRQMMSQGFIRQLFAVKMCTLEGAAEMNGSRGRSEMSFVGKRGYLTGMFPSG